MNDKPSFIRKTKNFTKAISRHAADGFTKVVLPQYIERLQACNECEFHENGLCNHEECGCILSKKAWWRSENCPIDKWPE
jgi:hypothetical protein